MEQVQEVEDPEQVEAWVEAAEAKVGEAVLQQARAVIAFAPTVVKEQSINWGPRVMSSNVLSAERL
jgi:hypothetical protein